MEPGFSETIEVMPRRRGLDLRCAWAAALQTCILFSLGSACASDIQPAPDAGLDSTLARMPKPWLTKPNRFDLREYQATLRYWRDKHPDIFQLRSGAAPLRRVCPWPTCSRSRIRPFPTARSSIP